MSNAIYDKGREAFLNGGINWTSDTIKVYLVDTGAYTVNLSTHQFASDVATGSKIATSSALTSKTTTAGVADAADITFTAVTGTSCEALIIWKDTGTQSTSPLIAYIDTATGLPVTPNGGDVSVTFDNGSNKILKL
jgi:hypothetical protein